MSTGAAYMKSLRQGDVQPWIDRTKRFLSEYDSKSQSIGVYGMGGKPIPPNERGGLLAWAYYWRPKLALPPNKLR